MNSKVIAVIGVAAILVAASAGVILLNKDRDSTSNNTIDIGDNYLKILGNANGDAYINDADLQVIQKYIDGETADEDLIKVKDANGNTYYLADADMDGSVDKKDIDYLKSLIDRSAAKVGVVDSFNQYSEVTLNVQKIAFLDSYGDELAHLFRAMDKVIGYTSYNTADESKLYWQGIPESAIDLGSPGKPDIEKLNEKDPDLTILGLSFEVMHKSKIHGACVGVDTLSVDFDNVERSNAVVSVLMIGYLLNAQDYSEKYVEWFTEYWNGIKNKTGTIAPENKKTVLATGLSGYISNGTSDTMVVYPSVSSPWKSVTLAGATNAIDSYSKLSSLTLPQAANSGSKVTAEILNEISFDYVFVFSSLPSTLAPFQGYNCDDLTKWADLEQSLKDRVLIKNAKDIRMVPSAFLNSASGGILSAVYIGTVVYPEIFSDYDVCQVHQSYLDMMGFEYDVSKHGVFTTI